jgi:uncharacterized membrane protein YfcA
MTETQSLLLWLVPLLVATGLVGGVLAGLLGVGGGIVIVPVLYHALSALDVEQAARMHIAVGTSLACIIPTSVRSMRAHQARGAFDTELFRAWMPGILLGVAVGTWAANRADFAQLATIFAVVAFGVALHMAFGRRDWKLGQRPPRGVGGLLVTGLIGALSAMMGIGGGTLSVPVLTLFGVPIHRAVGTAAGIGLLISVPATAGFVIGGLGIPGRPPWSAGYVSLLGFALIVPATLLAVPLGARLAHALNPEPLRRAFAAFLGITAMRMLWDVIGQ